MNIKNVIFGAGISGLSTAFWLHKNNDDFVILEKENEVGGAMKTIVKDGFQIDFGPNSGLETTPLIRQIVEEVGLSEEMVYAIDPFVSGVFAGDPNRLSVKSAFPKLYRLEELYGGLIKGMVKGAKERKKRAEQSKQNAKMFSFINGMQSFTKAIESKIGNKILFNSTITKVERYENKWKIFYLQNNEQNEIIADNIISTVPVHAADNIFSSLNKEFHSHATKIYYPPVMVLYLGYNKNSIHRNLDGFGYLIPSKEKKTYLGAIWSSTIFPNRCDENKAAFTLFVGGARAPHLFDLDSQKLIDKVLNEFQDIMKINGTPILAEYSFWKHAIPQYNIGYIEHENFFDKFEKENPGIFLGGNYRGGISVGDCIKNSAIIYDKILDKR